MTLLGGADKHPLYGAWRQMRMRCSNPSHHKFSAYGGRGIKVCERWQTFWNFVEDVGDRPVGCTLDRIDNDGDYEPGNVRWATPSMQNRNSRRSRLLTHDGETRTMAEWAEVLGMSYDVLNHRINASGWSVERALTTPVRRMS